MGIRRWVKTLLLCVAVMNGAAALAEAERREGEPFKQGGFYALYAENRTLGIPNLITEDFLLQAYSLLRLQGLAALEREQLLPALAATVDALHRLLAEKDPADAVTAKALAYVQLLSALLDGGVPAGASAAVRAELALIAEHASSTASPLWGRLMDYSRFKVQGRYSSDPELKRYFLASRYASSVLLAVVPSAATGLSDAQAEANAALAVELSSLLAHPRVAPHYHRLSGALRWHFGAADDLSAADVRVVAAAKGLSKAVALRAYARDNGRLPKVWAEAVNVDALEPGVSVAEVQLGWRLLPARWSADAQAQQLLVFDQSDALLWDCEECAQPVLASATGRGWQKSYSSHTELMALLGSDAAQQQVDAWQLQRYSAYDNRAIAAVAAFDRAGGLAAEQLTVLRTALAGDNSTAAGAGFWLWQRYIAQLYQKQSSSPYSKSISLTGDHRAGATLVRNTALYDDLHRLVGAHLARENSPLWREFAVLLERCRSISVSLDNGATLSLHDESFLNELDLQLMRLTGRGDAPVVVDLHRNFQEMKVLQAGLSLPRVRTVGEARGAGFAVQEMIRPLADSHDNASWREHVMQSAKGVTR